MPILMYHLKKFPQDQRKDLSQTGWCSVSRFFYSVLFNNDEIFFSPLKIGRGGYIWYLWLICADISYYERKYLKPIIFLELGTLNQWANQLIKYSLVRNWFCQDMSDSTTKNNADYQTCFNNLTIYFAFNKLNI